jgi:hypothetical protein
MATRPRRISVEKLEVEDRIVLATNTDGTVKKTEKVESINDFDCSKRGRHVNRSQCWDRAASISIAVEEAR